MIDLSLIPPGFRQVVELVGPTAAMALVERYGGLELHIPTRFSADMPLCALVGPETARKLVRMYGHTKLYIPLCQRALVAARNAEILARYQAGEPPRVIARDCQMTERWVWEIIRKTRRERDGGDGGQGELFGEG